MKGLRKIVRKSSAWWKHGRHGSWLEVVFLANRLAARGKRGLAEELDLTRPDWSSRRGRR